MYLFRNITYMVEKSVGVQAKKQAHWEVYVYVKAFVPGM